MSRVNTKELKSIHNFDFYPGHYLTSSLAEDAKSGGFDGQSLAKSRQELEKQLQRLADGELGREDASNLRKTLAERVFELLGYYKVDGISSYQASFRCKNLEYSLHVDKRFPLKAEGDLWIILDSSHASEQDDGSHASDDEVADDRSIRRGEIEHFYQKPINVTLKSQQRRLAWKDVISAIFDSDTATCEWLIINQGDRLILTERGRWQEASAYIEVSLASLFALNDQVEYQCVDALFSPKAFPIESAEFFHETLERNAHKKAAEVTKALRDTVRQSIEIIANEILANHRLKPLPSLKSYNLKVKSEADQAAQIVFDQSLRYIYRILFMLFAESQERREGALPVQSRPYQLGYAMERLRDLEAIPFIDKERHFIQQTLAHATRIYFKGYNTDIVKVTGEDGETYQKTDGLGFSFPSLGTDLFDDAKTALFLEATLSDGEMQKVIRHLSLAKVGSGRATKTQRVHYAGLGLNQLGAVYEGLLSLKPEIMLEDVVLLAKDKKAMAHRYVPAKDRNKLDAELLAHDEDGLMTHKAGEFLLTPVGLERKFSASFYTPEVLTRFLAREAVETLLEKDASLKRLENLKICEPAMGSGAFLNAVVDELAPRMAREYRRLDQEDLDRHLEKCRKQGVDPTQNPGPVVHEMGYYLAKAKFHLMQRCVFGVDLNPTAVELAKVSLWLNCLHNDGNLPFLDFKLKHGNSLVGCWITRHHYEGESWPHFLVPNPKALDPHLQGTVLGIKKWPFIERQETRDQLKAIQKSWSDLPHNPSLKKRLDALTSRIQQLYEAHLEYLSEYRQAMIESESAAEKLSVFEKFKNQNTAYNQLRSMMDYWCALWFWPHSEIESVPNAEHFLRGLEWMAETPLKYGGQQRSEQLKRAAMKELPIARSIALQQSFFHWDLEFSDIFAEGGFDLVLGNPPWAPVKWDEADFFESVSPGITSTKKDAKAREKDFDDLLQSSTALRRHYKDKKSAVGCFAVFLNHSETYIFHDSSLANTYKYFYQRFFDITKQHGIHAMIAQDGIMSDQGSVPLRAKFYGSLKRLRRFKNELCLFEDNDHHVEFCIWYCEKEKSNFKFELIDNIYHPDTVAKCKSESPRTAYRGMKDDDGNWELRGHPSRIVMINESTLKALAKLDKNTNWEDAKLPIIHGIPELMVLSIFGKHPFRLSTEKWSYIRGFSEGPLVKSGVIIHETRRVDMLSSAVLTGPVIYVSNPAAKQPRSPCHHNSDYDSIDLEGVDDDFFPKTTFFVPNNDENGPTKVGSTGVDTTKFFRLVTRTMVSTTGARTLSSALIPPGPHLAQSLASLSCNNNKSTVIMSGLFNSIIYDFYIRSISGGNITDYICNMIPELSDEQLKSPLVPALISRAMRLGCISRHYDELWNEVFPSSDEDLFVLSSYSPHLKPSIITKSWQRNSCIRNKKAREQALCEIDAIVAILFGFEKEILLNLYRSQFGVLQKNLQDLPGQVPDPDKYHFPRFQQMSDAYDQCVRFLKDRGPGGKKAA